MKILITGSAGFIGSALSLRLLERGDEVIGVDNLNDYYDVGLKQARLARTLAHPGFTDLRLDIQDREGVAAAFRAHRPQRRCFSSWRPATTRATAGRVPRRCARRRSRRRRRPSSASRCG